ncbi:hypothetical protein [Nostoc sp. FACHB-280]|uniref:hypothetical protein n=1 Tax=Nostoc sp. FACHB-280 TaxID=2692839 RepID=UPI00168BD8AF|nr:hypothetical protein [Nostoc sp. FACHB-280]MBD2492850.1 hypothetical protein [Nostoc sp. FACHB-280]
MNPKIILGLLIGASFGLFLPVGSQSVQAASFESQSELKRTSSIEFGVVDLAGGESAKLSLADNSERDSSSNNDSNSDSDSGDDGD